MNVLKKPAESKIAWVCDLSCIKRAKLVIQNEALIKCMLRLQVLAKRIIEKL